MTPAPARLRAALTRLLPALLAALCLWAAAAPGAGAQAIDLQGLFSRDEPASGGPTGEEPLMSRPSDAPQRDRPPELAAYGALQDYAAEDSMVRLTTEQVSLFRQRLEAMLRGASQGAARLGSALAARSPDGEAGYFAGVALVTVILILIGRAVVQLYAVFLARPLMIAAQRASPPVGIAGRLPVLALRMGLTVVAAGLNLAVAAGLGVAIAPNHPPTQATAGILLAAYVAFLLVDTAWRMVISPYLSEYRIPRLSDAAARRLYLWVSAATFAGVISHAIVAWLREMGADPELTRLSAIGLSTIALAVILCMISANRAGIRRALLHARPPERASWLTLLGARLWAPGAAVYFVAAWLVGAFRLVMGEDGAPAMLAGAFAVLMLALVVQAVGFYLTERLFAPRRLSAAPEAPGAQAAPAEAAAAPVPAAAAPEAGGPMLRAAEPPEAEEDAPRPGDAADVDGDGDEEGGGGPRPAEAAGTAPAGPPRRGMRSFEDLARRVSTLFALGAAAYLLVRIWGGTGIFAEGSLFGRFENVIDILFIGYVAYHAVRIWLDRRIAAEGVDDFDGAGDEGGASSVSRLGTLLPLFRSAVLAVIGVSVALVMLMELGLNVAPLFAGAGIVGIAIGFGAQTLVRDILSGVFFLLDDAFRKGEYIDVGEVKGTVEKISVRSFQLRHHLGALHTIPFGEITHLTNFSRDWVMMKLPLRVTYDTDVERVRKLVKKLGEELLEHPTEGRKFLQPLKSQGVYQMEDSAMIVRIKYMTRPGDQWTTRKLVYQRIRELFEQEGIHFAHKEVTVRMPDMPRDRPLTEDERRAAGAAARRAVDEAEEDAAAGGGMAAAAQGR